MWTLRSRDALPLWRLDDPAGSPAVVAGFTTRRGGVSAPPYDSLNLGRSTADLSAAVEENRRRVLDTLGFDPALLVTVGQVHRADVAIAEAPGFIAERDAVVTRVPGLALAVSSADCLPLLFLAGSAAGAAHAGWRGAAAGIAEATLRVACEVGAVSPDRARVHLGPCIRACCYEIGPEVAAQFPAEALVRREDSLRLDIPRAVRLRLLAAGMSDSAIHDTGACTACEPHWYFSHRRDGGLTGRHWGVIGCRAA